MSKSTKNPSLLHPGIPRNSRALEGWAVFFLKVWFLPLQKVLPTLDYDVNVHRLCILFCQHSISRQDRSLVVQRERNAGDIDKDTHLPIIISSCKPTTVPVVAWWRHNSDDLIAVVFASVLFKEDMQKLLSGKGMQQENSTLLLIRIRKTRQLLERKNSELMQTS